MVAFEMSADGFMPRAMLLSRALGEITMYFNSKCTRIFDYGIHGFVAFSDASADGGRRFAALALHDTSRCLVSPPCCMSMYMTLNWLEAEFCGGSIESWTDI